MNKIKTYGKVKSKAYVKSDLWDQLKGKSPSFDSPPSTPKHTPVVHTPPLHSSSSPLEEAPKRTLEEAPKRTPDSSDVSRDTSRESSREFEKFTCELEKLHLHSTPFAATCDINGADESSREDHSLSLIVLDQSENKNDKKSSDKEKNNQGSRKENTRKVGNETKRNSRKVSIRNDETNKTCQSETNESDSQTLLLFSRCDEDIRTSSSCDEDGTSSKNPIKIHSQDDSQITSELTNSFSRSVEIVSSRKKKRSFYKIQKAGVFSKGTKAPKPSKIIELLLSDKHEEVLLTISQQEGVISIQDYIKRGDFRQKLGEGSFSEVFEKIDENGKSCAVKIIPFGYSDVLVNGDAQINLSQVIPEIVISKILTEAEERGLTGFVKLNRVVFCKGAYPEKLVNLWEDWNEDGVSENDHPEIFTDDQTYIVLENSQGGVDLEKFRLKTFKQALQILKQIVETLAKAEEVVEFEHRDLHWGNVLIDQQLNVNIIDFTLSRLFVDNCVVFTDLREETTIFEGEGDIQYDVYRQLKKHNKNEWKTFKPYTNVLWVKYLTGKMVEKLGNHGTVTLKKFLTRAAEYRSCGDMLQDALLKRKI